MTPLFLPAIGMVVVFAALGPAVGGATFIPLAMLLEAQDQAALHMGWIAGLIGHAYALIPAYLLGLLPAAFTGLTYALYDAWAPAAWPRALAAAALGALLAHGLYLGLMWAGAEIGVWINGEFGGSVADIVGDWTSGEVDASLHQALLASGAAAGFVSACAARLMGLTLQPRRRTSGA